MAKNRLSKSVAELLNKQLKTIEIRRKNASQFSDDAGKYGEIDKIIDLYENKLLDLMEKSVRIDDEDDKLPLVLIGSEVNVLDLDSGESASFQIVNTSFFELDENHVTFVSPIGKALLFKKVGDKVSVKIPIGVINYEIKGISLHNEVDFNN